MPFILRIDYGSNPVRALRDSRRDIREAAHDGEAAA